MSNYSYDQVAAEFPKLLNFDAAKDNIYFKIKGKDIYGYGYSELPYAYTEQDGYVFTYWIKVSERATGMTSVMIDNKMLEGYGISVEELHELALSNTPNIFPPRFEDMGRLMARLMSNEPSVAIEPSANFEEQVENAINTSKQNMFCITNMQTQFGASAIFCPKVLETVGEKLGTDFYMLPSSIHEVIVLPDSANIPDVEDLTKMVVDINRAEVAPEERLSNIPMFYSCSKQMLMQVDSMPYQLEKNTMRGPKM